MVDDQFIRSTREGWIRICKNRIEGSLITRFLAVDERAAMIPDILLSAPIFSIAI